MNVRAATPRDADAITLIYNEGIASRRATFETEPRSVEEIRDRIESALPIHAWLVAVDQADLVVGWAATMPYAKRQVYAGVAEFSIYVSSSARGKGVGKLLLTSLLTEAESAGIHKVTSRVFVDNDSSRALCAALGFREVGVQERHGRLDGVWRDVITVEILLGLAAH